MGDNRGMPPWLYALLFVVATVFVSWVALEIRDNVLNAFDRALDEEAVERHLRESGRHLDKASDIIEKLERRAPKREPDA